MKETQLVGLIPCAGSATRLGILPFSKELYPIGFDTFMGIHCLKVVSSYLIEQMMDAGVKDFHFIIKEEKKDISAYFDNFDKSSIEFSYHLAKVDYGVPFSLNTAYLYIKDKVVCLGFPDILFKPKKVFNQLLDKLLSNPKTSIVLGVMPVERPEKADLIEYDSENRIKRIVIKSKTEKNLKYGWICAVWNSSFTEYLNAYILDLTNS
ncbi:MAG: dTDP-glucose pyrophosphorylase, partial [Flavobacteriaceae bacterium]|nr:dTDP-glucose pyrophosphorylase [Flavobacteriaceae bacterium]